MELRAYVNSSLRRVKEPKANLTKQEKTGLSQLKKDKERVILTADKGVAIVIMDREDYNSKAQQLLTSPAYKSLARDPTNKIKAQLITKLRRIKKDSNLRVRIGLCILPVVFCQSFMGYPKSTKQATPLGQ